MLVTALQTTGNSAKFQVLTNKKAAFVVALSFTLRTKIWQLADRDAELAAARQLAEAIVSRHDPALPFKPLYIFAEHNTESSLETAIQRIRKYGFDRRPA